MGRLSDGVLGEMRNYFSWGQGLRDVPNGGRARLLLSHISEQNEALGEMTRRALDYENEIAALRVRNEVLEAENERLRAVAEAAKEGCDACHKYNGADYCCDCYHAGSGTHDALAALDEEVD